MEGKEFEKLVKDIEKERQKLLIGKSHDYATTDVLSNFKRMHVLCKTLDIDPRRSSQDCAMFLLMLKMDRWNNLKSQGKTPENESVKDTIFDAHNYIDLAFGCSEDADSCTNCECEKNDKPQK